MPDDDLFDILNLITSRRNRISQLMLFIILDSAKHICHLRSPDFRIVLSTTCFPEDETFVGVRD